MTYIKVKIDLDDVINEVLEESPKSELIAELESRGVKIEKEPGPAPEPKEAIRQIMIEKLGWSNFASDANVIHELRKMFTD